MNVGDWNGAEDANLLRIARVLEEHAPRELLRFPSLLDVLMRWYERRAPLRIPRGIFNLDNYSVSGALNRFRFDHRAIRQLAQFLLPEGTCHTSHGDTFSNETGLCLTLRILARGCALADLIGEFYRSVPWLSRVFNCVLVRIAPDITTFLRGIDEHYLQSGVMEELLGGITDAIGLETGVYGFVDGTHKFLCNLATSSANGAMMGRKKAPSLNFQALLFGNGLVHSLSLPEAGARHDSYCFHKWGVAAAFARMFRWGRRNNPIEGMGVSVYTDSAYARSSGVIPCAKQPELIANPDYVRFHECLRFGRSEIEHYFSVVSNNFRIFRMRDSMTASKRRVILFYPLAVFFANCMTCANGSNQVSLKFGMNPPSLADYLLYCADRKRRMP